MLMTLVGESHLISILYINDEVVSTVMPNIITGRPGPSKPYPAPNIVEPYVDVNPPTPEPRFGDPGL